MTRRREFLRPASTASCTPRFAGAMSGAPCARPSSSSVAANRVTPAPHAIHGQEVFSGMGDKLLVAGMIDGRHTHQLLPPSRVVMLHMLHELVLCQPGPADQHLSGVGDGG